MPTYERGAKGVDITRLEIALQELGLYDGKLDDTFGAGMEAAVQAYQQHRGLRVTGVVDEETHRRIVAETSPKAAAVRGQPEEYRSLALTAGFETSAGVPDCFAGLAGDFDGQGISFGVLQWNLGQGTLQPLLKKMLAQHPAVVQATFGDGFGALGEMLNRDRPAQLAWARTIQGPRGRSLKEPWHARFVALGRTTECQQIQVAMAGDRFRRARQLCGEYGLWSERGVALMFDIVVQNGSIRDETKRRIVAEFEALPGALTREEREILRMRIIANRRAEAARAEFIEDVRRRKLTIANGVGIVHGRGYDLERQFLLRLVPAALSSGDAAVPLPSPA